MGTQIVKETFIAGDPWVACDRCGFKYRRSKTRVEWTGLRVCTKTCFEKRHPQLSLKARNDRQEVVDPRPEPKDEFLDIERPYIVSFTPKVRVTPVEIDPVIISQDPLQYRGRKGDE